MKMEVDGRTVVANVAPLMSSEKAAFARRQLLSTLLGGVRIAPGMPLKVHLAQFVVWALPPILVVAVAVGLANEKVELRCIVAAAVGAANFAATELVRWALCRKGRAAEEPRAAWFTDYDDIDFSRCFSSATCSALLPPKRSWPHFALAALLSAAVPAVAAGALDAQRLEADLGGKGSSGAAVTLSVLCLLAVATASFGLVACTPVEVTTHRYHDPLTVEGLVTDLSRPLVLLVLLGPVLVELPRPLGVLLRAVGATLPLLWGAGIMPQLDTLALWALDQLEVQLFGGRPAPRALRLLAGTALSVLSAAAVALATWAAKASLDQSGNGREDELPAIVAAAVALPLASLLAPLPPRLGNCTAAWTRRVGLAGLQALLGGGAGLGVLLGLGADTVQASLNIEGRTLDVAWVLRLCLEQVSAILCFVALECVSARRLRADAGLLGCLLGRRTYASARDKLLWGAGSRGPGGGSAAAAAAAVADRVARIYALMEAPVRLLLVMHAVGYGSVAMCQAEGGPALGLEAVALLRALRVVIVETPRAAADAWLTGILDLILAVSGAKATEGYPTWSLCVRLLVISVARQRLVRLAAGLCYALHLAWATASTKKLRHPVTGKVLLTNALLFPLVLLVLIASAALESPLVAVFTLPLFVIGYPRPRHGHPELAPDGQPASKGVEGLFYSILMPSLLRGLAPRWRCGALDCRPGAMLFCRSHERLACVVRVLSSGFGWAQVEVRGLEMQEPTSCHHVEAGKIDDAFAAVLTGSLAPRAFGGNPSLSSTRAEDPRLAGASAAPGLVPFALRPACEVTALCYEQTVLSLRGIIDQPDALRQVHRVFLKTLVWVFARHARGNGSIPKCWLTCPLKSRDAQIVMNLLGTSTWPRQVAVALGLHGNGNSSEETDAASCNGAYGAYERPVAEKTGLGSVAVWSGSTSPSIVSQDQETVKEPTSPVPPPGSPPTETCFRNGRISPLSPSGPSQLSGQPTSIGSSPGNRVVDLVEASEGDNLDTLFDMVLDMAPSGQKEPASASKAVQQPSPTTFGAQRSGSGLSPDSGGRRPSDAGSRRGSSSLGQPLRVGEDEVAWTPEKKALLRQGSLRQPKQLPPLDIAAWSSSEFQPVPFPGQPAAGVLATGSHARSLVLAQPRAGIGGPEDLGGLARMVVQAYTAVNVAPACGQIPEALGTGHIFRVFSGQLGQGNQAPEVAWLHEQSEFRELTLKAFRFAFKITVDCIAMTEDASALEYSELDVALQELDRDWHLGEETSPSWQAAMEQRVPNLLALRRSSTSDIQVLRHTLREDGVRVGELKSEVVQSIWASQSLELRYLTNDDDERYSIQAHPTLLRNMIVQSAEYPIFVSPPTTVWL